MDYIGEVPRMCWICEGPIHDSSRASYITVKGLPLLQHTACGEAMNEAIEERRNPKPVRKAPAELPVATKEAVPGVRASDGEIVTKQDAIDFIQFVVDSQRAIAFEKSHLERMREARAADEYSELLRSYREAGE
jgi:hypothetical protein